MKGLNMRRSRSRHSVASVFELLEGRLLMANILAQVVDQHARADHGWLILTGTSAGETFRVTPGTAVGEFDIDWSQPPIGLEGPMETVELAGVTQGIRIQLGGGDDKIQIVGCDIAGDVIVGAGAGDDQFTLDSSHVTGRVSFKGGRGNDSVTITNNSSVGGVVSICDHGSNSVISLTNSSVGGLRAYNRGEMRCPCRL